MVAVVWHQTGMVHENSRQYEAAEHAYQRSLNIKVQTGNRGAQASTLNQLGNLYSSLGRSEDSVRFLRQAAEIFVARGDLSSEGVVRNNIANNLVKLLRYDDARLEIQRAIECKKPFGHAAEPWLTFDILSYLEREVGNEPAALAARKQAFDAYLAYRRDGGASEIDIAQLIALVRQDPDAARAAVDDPEINYAVAAEILLLL
jgi:tetratricopeptide (TPR) repeat protein